MRLYNTLSRTVEEFKPIDDQMVRMYTCGPTVYDYAHIGNLRTYIFEDVLRRALEYNGYRVEQAMNITDVGHLVGDGDEGEDKMEVGAAREGKSPLEIARQYEAKFFEDLKMLNVELPQKTLRATDAIAEQIDLIKELEKKGFIYSDDSAIYFDTSKLPDYGKLSGQKLADKKVGAREGVVVDSRKKNPADFALWFFLTGRYKNHVLHWASPWGEGFPGWHLECSAISRKLLGQPFDIHTGGVDHIGTHHTNEIAQSEAAYGLPLADYWIHGEFLLIEGGRMGKSEGNAYTLGSVREERFNPLSFRYFCLSAQYRTQLNFTWESLNAADVALNKLYDFVRDAGGSSVGCADYEADFLKAINDDLNTPKALAVMWDMIGDKDQPKESKLKSLLKFDQVLGLGLDAPPIIEISDEAKKLIDQREAARNQKDFTKSDELRKQIEDLGYEVMDTDEGQKIRKK